jgi:pre-mRNA-processing factor SLU7
MKSREEFKREKDLDEARKAGIAPAAKDSDGRDINPHIPQYMTKGLWYLNQEGVSTTLMHQKNWKTDEKARNEWYERGARIGRANYYRKGACENCGSMTHKPRECLERPRKLGAKFTGKHIAADDKIQHLAIKHYEAKRDRWNGYDAEDYKKLIVRSEIIEDYRRAKYYKKMHDSIYFSEPVWQQDEDIVGDDEQLSFDKVEKRVNTVAGGSTGTVRNLRIREDTAKYLLNLDLDSAYYDPKSRSMREDPNPRKPPHEKNYMGDNNIKTSGKEFQEFMELQLYQLNASEKGFDSKTNAAPSQAEALVREYKDRRIKLQMDKKINVISKYGDKIEKSHTIIANLNQTKTRLEYNRSNNLIIDQLVV